MLRELTRDEVSFVTGADLGDGGGDGGIGNQYDGPGSGATASNGGYDQTAANWGAAFLGGFLGFVGGYTMPYSFSGEDRPTLGDRLKSGGVGGTLGAYGGLMS